MLWFEPLFLNVLRHEYRGAMRFNAGTGKIREPSAPRQPCQLYVHIPFCEALCPFCSFHRVEFREHKARGYFEALQREIRLYHSRGFQFSDVYVGGGTPTVAPEPLIETLRLIRSLWPIQNISVETNPNHLRPDIFDALLSVDVRRLSVGVQSFDDDLLHQMQRFDRYGSGAAIRERLEAARGVFPTLNVDMIFNLPNQTVHKLDQDLQFLLDLRVDQASFYPLMTTDSSRRLMERTLGRTNPDRRHEFYERILQRLSPEYRASSAWCFSRKDRTGPQAIDEYIIDQENYVGVGSGAFSYVDGWMYSTTFSINQYRRRVAEGLTGITQSKPLRLKERMRYDFLMRLFGLHLPLEDMKRKYGARFGLLMLPELWAMRLIGAVRRDRHTLHLTPLGMYCWVLMMAEFFTAVNTFREQMRLHIREELGADAGLQTVRVALPVPGKPATRNL